MPAENNRGRKPLGIAEYLMAELRQAFQDIRQKVAEEGWFGRVVTAAPVIEMDRAQIEGTKDGANLGWHSGGRPQPTFEEQWAPRASGEPLPGQKRSPDLGADFDR